jgi:hypothetical protein
MIQLAMSPGSGLPETQDATRKYRKQPHAKEPAAAGVRQGNLTRRATQQYFSNIPK